MNVEVRVGKEKLPIEMIPEWFADQVAILVRGEDGHNVTVLFVGGKGVEISHEDRPSANKEEKALAKDVKDAIDATLARDDYPKHEMY